MRRRNDLVALSIVLPILLAVFACAATMTIGIRFARPPQHLTPHPVPHVAFVKWSGPATYHLTQNGRLVGDGATAISPGVHTFDVRDATGTHMTFVSGTFYGGYVTPIAWVVAPAPLAKGCQTPENTLIDDVF